MDMFKKVFNSKSGSSSSTNNGTKPGGDDFVDKAFATASSKFGWKLSKENRERITDAGRSQYEKSTGKKVDPKISN